MTTQIAEAPVQAPTVPDAIKVSPKEKLLFAVRGKGVQIYEPVARKDNPKQLEWTHVPEAELYDFEGNVVGHHYGGPTWDSTDGSSVVCDIKSHVESKDDSAAAPWLLLIVKSHEGKGVFSNVTSIQRLETVGGGEPAGQPKPGQHVPVPYTATYYCYGLKT